MSDESAILSAGAVALSCSATIAALVGQLHRIGVLSDEMQRDIYEDALLMLEESQGDDESGVFEAARELIEMHLRPDLKA